MNDGGVNCHLSATYCVSILFGYVFCVRLGVDGWGREKQRLTLESRWVSDCGFPDF